MATISKTCSNHLERLGERLRQVRLQQGRSMADFAKAVGISAAALHSMENGRPGVPIGQWAEVLRRLKCLSDFNLLLTGSGLQPPTPHRGHRRGIGFRTLGPML
jgi:transcriptional regulator with XRE-family HTH domain